MIFKDWLGRVSVPPNIGMKELRSKIFEREISRSDFVDDFPNEESVRVRVALDDSLGDVLMYEKKFGDEEATLEGQTYVENNSNILI